MNEIQSARSNAVHRAKTRVHKIEDALWAARHELKTARTRLQQAIDADPTSWHATPGILK